MGTFHDLDDLQSQVIIADGRVETYVSLPIIIGTPVVGSVYLVEQPTTILFGAYTTKQSGLYIRDNNTGALSDWRRLNVKVKFTDGEWRVVDAGDQSKQGAFDMSNITTATTRTLTWPDKDGSIAILSDITLKNALSNDPITGSNDIVITSGDQIKSDDDKVKLKMDTETFNVSAGVFPADASSSSISVNKLRAILGVIKSDFTKGGLFGMYANDVADVMAVGTALPNYCSGISTMNGTIRQNIIDSVFMGGKDMIMKTSESAYLNQLAYNTGTAGETIIKHTPSATDYIQTHQARSGDIALNIINQVIITQESDFPSPIGGKIPLANGVNYVIGVPDLVITKPLDLSNISTVSSLLGGLNGFTYTGSGSLFEGSLTGAFAFKDAIVFSGTGTNKIWDLTGNGNPAGNVLVIGSLSFIGFGGIGKLDNIGGVNMLAQYSNCGTGLVLKDISLLSINDSPISNVVTSDSPRVVLDGTFTSVTIRDAGITIQSGEAYLQISKNVIVSGDAVVSGNQFSNTLGGEFLASEKSNTGVTLSDNGSGNLRITSVAHGLTIEQVLGVLNSTLHDGDYDILSVVDANIVDLDTNFLGADTGDWTTGDSAGFRDDNMFEFRSNGDAAESSEEFSMELANPVTVIIPAPFTIVEMPSVLNDWVELEARRFGFELDGFGRIRVLHSKKRTYSMPGIFTAEPVSGGVQLIACYILINGVPIAKSVFEQATNRPVGFSPYEQSISPAVGDFFSLGWENQDTSNNIIVTGGVFNGI